MNRIFLRCLLFGGIFAFLTIADASDAFGRRPPWASGRGRGRPRPSPVDPAPVSAPEPTALSLIGIAIAGGAGYYLIKRKQKK